MPSWTHFKKHFEARSLEWFSGFVLTLWGCFMILEPNVFNGPFAHTFGIMAQIAPQPVWGLVALLVGLFRVTALFINGQWGITPSIRVLTCFFSIACWFWVCVGIYVNRFHQVEGVIYFALILADAVSTSRAASDAYEARHLRNLEKVKSENSSVTSIHRRA